MPFFNTPTTDRPRRPSTGQRVMAEMVGSTYGGAPMPWSAHKYEQVLHFKYWIFVALHAIARKIASLTPNVGLVTESEPTAHKFLKMGSPRRLMAKTQTPLRDSEDLEPLARDHALVELLNRPNDYDTCFDLWYETIVFLGLTGEAYWWLPPNGFGTPAEIHVIPSHWMTPRSYRPENGKLIDVFECRPIANSARTNLYFPADEICYFKYPSPLSKTRGNSQLASGDRWFDIAESIDQSRWYAMKQSLNASGVIELSADYYDPDDSEINRLQIKFLQNAGERRAGKPIVLSPGMKFTPLMISARELDHVNGAQDIRDMTLAMFQTPKAACGISNDNTRANHEGTMVGWCTTCINPTTAYLGQRATIDVAHKFDERARIWYDDCSPSDAAQVNADLDRDITAKILTKGEMRAKRGMPPFGDERDDEICGEPSPVPGTGGMPNIDDLFSDDAPTPNRSGDRMANQDNDSGVGNERAPDRMFQPNGKH